jgi:hypothetical protein
LGTGLFLAVGFILIAGHDARAQQMPTGPEAREVVALACAPGATRELPQALGTVSASTESERQSYATGDRLIVDGFLEESLAPGQLYFVRRALRPDDRATTEERPWINVHTLGWVRIEALEADHALASVAYACDAIEVGDYLAAFTVPVLPDPVETAAEPDFAAPGLLLFGADRREAHAAGSYVVVDRGSNDGVQPGQRVTFFRLEGELSKSRVILGDGRVVLTGPESATVQVETATRPVYAGDHVAFSR